MIRPSRTAAAAIAAISLSLAASSGLVGCAQDAEQAQGDTAGASAQSESAQAPDIALATIDGDGVALSDLRGKTVFLSFWGTWCPYCIQDMPELQQVKEEFSDVEVLMVNCGEDAQTVSDFAAENGYDFIWALDETYEAQQVYPVSGLPYTVVVDAEGSVVKAFAGSKRGGMLEEFRAAAQEAQA